MKLFLYTDAAQVDAPARRALWKAGYVPLKVTDLNAIKVIEPLPDLTGQQIDIITRAAIEAIQRQSITVDARQAFGAALARLLSEKPQQVSR